MTSALTLRVQARSYERRWWILAVLCFSLLVIVLDNTILNVAIPTIVRDLDATNSQLQWMVDAYTLSSPGCCSPRGASATGSGAAVRCRSVSWCSVSGRSRRPSPTAPTS